MANIFAAYANPVRSVADYQNDYDKQALVRGQLVGQTRINELAALQADQQRQTIGDTQRSNALIKAAYGVKPGATDDDVMQALRSSGDRGALEYAGKLDEQRGKRDETVAKTREAQAKAMQEVAGTVKRYATNVMSSPTQAAALAAIDNIEALHKHFGIPQNFDEERRIVASATSPDQIVKWASGNLSDANLLLARFVVHNNGKVQTFADMNQITNPAGPAPITMTTTPGEDSTAATARAGQAVQLAGQRSVAATAAAGRAQAEQHFNTTQAAGKWTYDSERGGQVNTQTGEFRPATQGGVPIGPKDKPLTEAQGKATKFLARMADASSAVADLEDKGVSSANLRTKAAGSDWTNWIASPEGQQYKQAASNWLSANLRDESGAAIGILEENKDYRKFFPQLNDDPATVVQKARSRRVAEEAMRAEAGPGAKQLPKILEASGGAAGAGNGGGKPGGNSVTTPDGKVHTFPNAAAAAQFKKAAGL